MINLSVLFTEYKPPSAEVDELDPMDPAAYSDTPRSVMHSYHSHDEYHIIPILVTVVQMHISGTEPRLKSRKKKIAQT